MLYFSDILNSPNICLLLNLELRTSSISMFRKKTVSKEGCLESTQHLCHPDVLTNTIFCHVRNDEAVRYKNECTP